jgi:GWxTD domain-containing protein
MRHAITYFLCITIILLLWGCSSVSNLSVHNFAGQYTETDEQGRLDIVPFGVNDSITKIYFRIPFSSFLYKTAGKAKISRAAFRLHFDVFTNYESQSVIDSGTFVFADSLHSGSGGMFNFEFDTRAAKGQNYLLSLRINDLNKKTFSNSTCYINRIAKSSSSSFKASQEGAGLLYSPVLQNKQPVEVITADTSTKSMWVSVFRRKFQLPAPPFSQDERPQFDYKPDSIFQLQLQKGVTEQLTFNKPGFYYFRSDTALLEGFTLFRFSEGFPELVNSRQMLGALRYITSAKEYEALSKQADTRSAVDSFWLATGGNADRALSLIRDYYSRVERANELFSSFTEGWQTDRGLIYIVLGPPNVVYRNNLQEEWVYGEAGNMHSMYFYFAKVVNPFTNADYILLRDPIMKQAWYMAVERWRR